jgi:2,3-bisphosphoglycerate-dependent phosphoglycerate mutase
MRVSLLLIRHCRSTGQRPEAPLTPAGTVDAAKLAVELDRLGVDAVYSSPFQRAHDTVLPFAQLKGLDIVFDDRLIERRLAAADLPDWLDHVRRSFDDLDYRAPGSESLREAQARGLAAMADVALQGHRLPALCTHGNLLSAILRSVDAGFSFNDWSALRNPDLFEIASENGRPAAYRRLALRYVSDSG